MSMSEDNRTSGVSRANDIPRQAYIDYANRDKHLEEARKMIGGQLGTLARDSAQIVDTVAKPSPLEQLFGTAVRAPVIHVDPPPGYDTQFLPPNPEYIFGATSHLRSLDETVKNMQVDNPQEQQTIRNVIDVQTKNMELRAKVLANTAMLRQG